MKRFPCIPLLIFNLIICSSCSRVVDLSQDEFYKKAIGKSFVLNKDYYLYQWDKGIPYIGKFDYFPVDEARIGKGHFREARIIGVVRKGQVVQISKVINSRSFEDSIIKYLVILSKPTASQQHYSEMDVTFLMNLDDILPSKRQWRDPPIFKSEAATPLESDGIWWK
jgi:hypothetical protein